MMDLIKHDIKQWIDDSILKPLFFDLLNKWRDGPERSQRAATDTGKKAVGSVTAKSSGKSVRSSKPIDSLELRKVIFDAIHNSDDAGVRSAIARGANINIKSWDFIGSNETPLYRAASKGDAKIVDTLLSNGADHTLWNGTLSPLVVAVRSGSVETVKAFLAHGIDAQEPYDLQIDSDSFPRRVRNSPLVAAVFGGRPEMVKTLLDAGARNEGLGETTLREASRIPAIAELLGIPAVANKSAASPADGIGARAPTADEIDAADMAKIRAEIAASTDARLTADRPKTARERHAARIADARAEVKAREGAELADPTRPTGTVRARGLEM